MVRSHIGIISCSFFVPQVWIALKNLAFRLNANQEKLSLLLEAPYVDYFILFFCCTLSQYSHLELSCCDSCLVVEFMKHLNIVQVTELWQWYVVLFLCESRR